MSLALFLLAAATGETPAAPAPPLEYAFTAEVDVGTPVEQGKIDGARRRFIAIRGGKVQGPLLHGEVLAAGGDWQQIHPDGLTTVLARYFLKTDDGTIVEVTNPGVRVATPEVTERLARGERVPADAYYFRTTPTFSVGDGPYRWMARSVFVARGVRLPDRVLIDFYRVR